MWSKNVHFGSSRFISFFGKKKPVTSEKDDSVFDLKSCFDNRNSSLKVTDSCSLEGCSSLPKVIVVGAGLSGMSAASKLLQAGIKDLLVLEATSRPGGRIMSAWVGDAMIELGPTVLQGASLANPVYTLANISGALTYPVKKLKSRRRIFLTGDGELITDYGVETLLFNQLISEAKAKKRLKPLTCSSNSHSNLMQYLGLRVQQELLNFPENARLRSEKVLWGMINSLRIAYGAELSEISANAFADRAHTPGGNIILEGGMHRILSSLLQQIPEDKLLLNCPIHKILLDPCPQSNKPVKVLTCESNILEADFVIVTIPIGVLKKRGSEMLGGALTKVQINAIKDIGVGRENHIYLEYSQPWWIPGMADMALAWTMEELQTSNEWMKGVACIREVFGSRHLLAVDVAGPEAELIESVAEEEVAIQITRFLRKFTGDTSIPFPTNIVVTRWTCDPYFQGSTVYVGQNTTPGTFKDLSNNCSTNEGEPATPVILAGDGTIPEYYGTMEGARRSGITAAIKIIDSTKMNCEMKSKGKSEQSQGYHEKQEAQQCC